MHKVLKFALLFTLLAPRLAGANGGFFYDTSITKEYLEGLEVNVQIEDNATGACWTNLKEVREYAEEKLRMKGVKILTEEKAYDFLKNFRLDISLIADRVYEDGSGPCYGAIILSLRTFSKINESVMWAVAGEARFRTLRTTNLNRTMIETLSKFIAEFK